MQGGALTVAALPPLENVDWAVSLAIWLAVAITLILRLALLGRRASRSHCRLRPVAEGGRRYSLPA